MEDLRSHHPVSRRRFDRSKQNHGREAPSVSETLINLAVEN